MAGGDARQAARDVRAVNGGNNEDACHFSKLKQAFSCRISQIFHSAGRSFHLSAPAASSRSLLVRGSGLRFLRRCCCWPGKRTPTRKERLPVNAARAPPQEIARAGSSLTAQARCGIRNLHWALP